MHIEIGQFLYIFRVVFFRTWSFRKGMFYLLLQLQDIGYVLISTKFDPYGK